MPLADAPANALLLVPLVFWLTVGFLLGDLVGLLSYFLARSRNRPGMAALALLSCGVAGAVFLPSAVLVAAAFAAAVVAMGRHDPIRRLERRAAAGGDGVGLRSESFLPR